MGPSVLRREAGGTWRARSHWKSGSRKRGAARRKRAALQRELGQFPAWTEATWAPLCPRMGCVQVRQGPECQARSPWGEECVRFSAGCPGSHPCFSARLTGALSACFDVPSLLHVPHLRVCILSRKRALAIHEGQVWKPSPVRLFILCEYLFYPVAEGYLGCLWNSQNSYLTVLFLRYLGLQCCPALASGFEVNNHPHSSRHPLCGTRRRAPALAFGNCVPTVGVLVSVLLCSSLAP